MAKNNNKNGFYINKDDIKLFLDFYNENHTNTKVEEMVLHLIDLINKYKLASLELNIVYKYLHQIYIANHLFKRNKNFTLDFEKDLINLYNKENKLTLSITFNNPILSKNVVNNAIKFIKNQTVKKECYNKVLDLINKHDSLYEKNLDTYKNMYFKTILKEKSIVNLNGFTYEVLIIDELDKIFKISSQHKNNNGFNLGPDLTFYFNKLRVNIEISTTNSSNPKNKQYKNWISQKRIKESDLNIFICSNDIKPKSYKKSSFNIRVDKSNNVIIDKEWNRLRDLLINAKLQSHQGNSKYIY